MVSSEDLHKELVALSNSIEKKYWTYYFLESLDNFIYFLDRIKSDSIKGKASNMINSGLNEIDSMDKNEESITVVTNIFTLLIFII